MKLEFDLSTGEAHLLDDNGRGTPLDLSQPEAFGLMAKAWLRATWDSKYIYSFTWLGRPIIQLPDDLLRLQELVFSQKPDFIVETGIAHGGSLIFHASLAKAMGHGHVVGIDIDIRPHNRAAMEDHPLYQEGWITMIEGSSVDPAVVAEVVSRTGTDTNVLVILDSNHTKDHVAQELALYSPLVPVGGSIVACDGGIMAEVVGAARAEDDWSWNNPAAAAQAFAESNPQFDLLPPLFLFNEGTVQDHISYFGNGHLRRIS